MNGNKLDLSFRENSVFYIIDYGNNRKIAFEITKEEALKIAHKTINVYEKGDYNEKNNTI